MTRGHQVCLMKDLASQFAASTNPLMPWRNLTLCNSEITRCVSLAKPNTGKRLTIPHTGRPKNWQWTVVVFKVHFSHFFSCFVHVCLWILCFLKRAFNSKWNNNNLLWVYRVIQWFQLVVMKYSMLLYVHILLLVHPLTT